MASHQQSGPGFHGLMAEFTSPTDLVAAAEATRDAGFTRWNCYSPYPIEGAWEAMGHKTPMSKLTFIGGLVGAVSSFAFITWTQVIDYPWNIGGRPTFSWPAWIPPTFETTILLAGLTAGIGMLAVNGFPRHHHPVFNVPAFARASDDRYFLVIETGDPKFDQAATESFLRGLNPEEVSQVDE
jgi:hypothetical protein